MKVKELLSRLRQPYYVEIRENNFYLCETTTDSKVIEVFYDREVIDWFPTEKGVRLVCGLVINIAEVE